MGVGATGDGTVGTPGLSFAVKPPSPGKAAPLPLESIPQVPPVGRNPFDDGLSDGAAEARRRRRELYRPIRSMSTRTMCCVATVVGLAQALEGGGVVGATLLSFQRCLLTRVDVLEGGALVAPGEGQPHIFTYTMLRYYNKDVQHCFYPTRHA